MSVVTGVTLHISCCEESVDLEYPMQRVDIVEQINAWLKERGFGPLVQVHHLYGGTKHPQVYVFGAGYNVFHEDEFSAFFMTLTFDEPGNAVLLLNPEDGDTKIYRPGKSGDYNQGLDAAIDYVRDLQSYYDPGSVETTQPHVDLGTMADALGKMKA